MKNAAYNAPDSVSEPLTATIGEIVSSAQSTADYALDAAKDTVSEVGSLWKRFALPGLAILGTGVLVAYLLKRRSDSLSV